MHGLSRRGHPISTGAFDLPGDAIRPPEPGEALPLWLGAITMRGAASYWSPSCRLPITRRPASVRQGFARELIIINRPEGPSQREMKFEADSWAQATGQPVSVDEHEALMQRVNDGPRSDLVSVLHAGGIDKPRRALRALIQMVAPDPLRADNWPAAGNSTAIRPGGPYPAWLALHGAQKLGRPARAIVAAARHDVEGWPLQKVAEGLLGSEHLLWEPVKEARWEPGEGGRVDVKEGTRASAPRLRNTERTINLGRGIWAILGAWPWTHARRSTFVDNRGRGGTSRRSPTVELSERWWEDPEYTAPLGRWHEDSWREAQFELEQSRAWAGWDTPSMVKRWRGMYLPGGAAEGGPWQDPRKPRDPPQSVEGDARR